MTWPPTERAGVAAPMVLEVLRRPSSPTILSPSGVLLDDGSDYAAVVQGLLAEPDRAGACGWVADLRANRGGNFGPMLAGIGPPAHSADSTEVGA